MSKRIYCKKIYNIYNIYKGEIGHNYTHSPQVYVHQTFTNISIFSFVLQAMKIGLVIYSKVNAYTVSTYTRCSGV